MKSQLGSFTDSLLDTLLSQIICISPKLRGPLLSELGSRLHASAARVLFKTVDLPDDARYLNPRLSSLLPTPGAVSALITNPVHYGGFVKRFVVKDPLHFAPLGKCYINKLSLGEPDLYSRPLDSTSLNELLHACGTSLEEFIWTSNNLPPDGICQTLTTCNNRLTTFSFEPTLALTSIATSNITTSATRLSQVRWDGPSLPLLSSLSLTTLRLSRLSQAGSKALGLLFSKLGEYSNLEDVTLDFMWLDDGLCEKIVEAGRRIKRMQVGTCGTKLSDKGIVALIEGCDSLEEFALIEVQGRLSRNLWSKITVQSHTLQTFKIHISESGPHHSWTTDHLLAFPSLSCETLTYLSIIRIVRPFDSQVDEVATLRPIPRNVVEKIRSAKHLLTLECDWWSWKPEDMRTVFDSCARLKVLKLAFDGPFAKLLSSTAVFNSVPRLWKLSVSVAEHHAPSPSSSPSVGQNVLTSVTSPLIRLRGTPSSIEVVSPISNLSEEKNSSDPCMPALRDIKKFARRCPSLVELEWYGRNGRGIWIVDRLMTTPKPSSNLSVVFIGPQVLSGDMWEQMRSGEEALHHGWLPGSLERVGHIWTGPKAEEMAAERAAEKEKEDISPSSKSLTGSTRRNGSISSATDSSLSPIQPFSPIQPSPPMTRSLRSTSVSSITTPTANSSTKKMPPSSNTDNLPSPRRAPSESSLQLTGESQTGVRIQAATSSDGKTETSNSPGGKINTSRGRGASRRHSQYGGTTSSRGIGRGGVHRGKVRKATA